MDPVDFNDIRAVTSRMQQVISSGTIDSPTWDLVRTAKLAARIYAPLGTYMSLGDHVRAMRAFLEAFKSIGPRTDTKDGEVQDNGCPPPATVSELRDDIKVGLIHSPQISESNINRTTKIN